MRGCISEGVPPPKKMLATSRGPVSCRGVLELAQVGCEETGLVDAAEAHVAVEVAVGALLGAERPVDVDAEARVGQAPACSRQAR